MKALFCYSKDKFLIEELEKPPVGDDQLLLRMLLCGLCGSDIIKIFDKNTKKPAVYGHEVVGEVVQKGKKVSRFDIGDVVVAAHHIPCFKCHYCRHKNHSMCRHFKETNIYPGGFSEFIRLSAEHIENTTFRLPEGQVLKEAVFIEPLACCIRAMERVETVKGDWFSVVGTGAIGMLFIQLIKLYGCRAAAIDLDQERLNLARKMGADCIVNPAKDSTVETLRAASGIGIDTAILTVTNRATVDEAIAYLRDGGTINIFGAAEKNIMVPLNFETIYKREITIKSTYSSTPDTLEKAYRLITDKKVDVSPLVSSPLPLSQFKKGLDLMLERKAYKPVFKL
ncbi:MAG: zinc-binding dehydrogenase [Actinomycetota bacterium]